MPHYITAHLSLAFKYAPWINASAHVAPADFDNFVTADDSKGGGILQWETTSIIGGHSAKCNIHVHDTSVNDNDSKSVATICGQDSASSTNKPITFKSIPIQEAPITRETDILPINACLGTSTS